MVRACTPPPKREPGARVGVSRSALAAIIANALRASLTEEDVQANKPQKEAYEHIIFQFSEPEDCTKIE